jgi:hypothetical protein
MSKPRRGAVSLFAGVLLAVSLVMTVDAGPAHATTGVTVSVGYADNLHSSPTNFPTPWEGSPNVIFEGCDVTVCTSGGYDGGAVMVTNNTAHAVVVDYVEVKLDTCIYDIWPHSVTLPAGDELIVDQTAPGASNGCTPGTYTAVSGGQLMDSSDIGLAGAGWSGVCTQSGLIPEVDVSINGTPLAPFLDTGQVLNTGGVDGASCSEGGFPAGNESRQWSPIGVAACVGTIFTLDPAAQTHATFSAATVTAVLANGCGDPLQGATVTFTVLSGPNAGTTGTAVTDANGNASFTYSSTLTGTDTLEASVSNPAGTITSNTVTVTWVAGGSNIHAVVQIETSPSYAGDVVQIDSSQLESSCGGTITFEDLQPPTAGDGGLGTTSSPTIHNNNIQATLDDDGNATVIVDGSDCAAGMDLIEADMTQAPFLTALTTLDVQPPQVTPSGLTAAPTSEVETGNSAASGESDVYTVFYVETDPVYAEQPVEISSPQLEGRCGLGWRWEPANGGAEVDGVPPAASGTATTTLDDDGNAVFVFKGASCAAGDSTVTADVLAGTHPTYNATFTITAPTAMASVMIKGSHRHRHHHGGGTGSGSGGGSGGSPAPMTVIASPNPLVETGS